MADVVTVEFDEAIQSSDALSAAAYRLLDAASCQIDKSGGKFVCRLTLKNSAKQDSESIRLRFLDCVTDENLRERLAAKTEPVRNLILSLAFGSLASRPSGKSE
jgi:His-Xaa-Ser system protein HxsD